MDEKLDILVISHNNVGLIDRCLDAIYRRTALSFHLIVVDDSTDLTLTYLNQFKEEHKNCTIVHSDKPYENSYQVINDGLKRSKTPYVALIVNSVIVEPEWEIAGLQVMKTSPKIGILGFKQLHYGTGTIESAGLASSFGGSMLSDIGGGRPSHRLSKVYECDAVAWAFVLLRKAAVVGTMERCLYHGWKGWEEIETCMIVRENGWKIFYCGLGVGYHQTRATRGAQTDDEMKKLNQQNMENREIFAKRWGYWESYHQAVQKEYFPDMKPRDKKMALSLVAGVTRDANSFRLAGLKDD